MRRYTFCLPVSLLPAAAAAAEQLPAGFVYLRDIAPGIAQDMRYAGFDNFTGRRCPAMARPNACCGATRRRRSRACEADLAKQQLGAQNLRLLSPDARGRRLCALGARDAR